MRDEQRQRLAHPPWEVLVGVDGDEAVDVQGTGHVDVDDAGVRVRGPDERRRQRLAAQIVQEPTLAGEQPGILAALDGPPEFARPHQDSPGDASAAGDSSAARWTALMMFW
jgi:hypothetical protein